LSILFNKNPSTQPLSSSVRLAVFSGTQVPDILDYKKLTLEAVSQFSAHLEKLLVDSGKTLDQLAGVVIVEARVSSSFCGNHTSVGTSTTTAHREA
jgi:hypothetical protein